MLRRAAHVAIRVYQLTLSGLVGRQCRHWPSCSDYTDAAIARHGLWPGGWMGFSRICRCGPLGTHGIDLVPEALPPRGRWYRPWAYARWRGVNAPPNPFSCDAVEPANEPASPPSRVAPETSGTVPPEPAAMPALPAGHEPPHTPGQNDASVVPGRKARQTSTETPSA